MLLALPIFGLKTGMPSIKVVPTSDGSRIGYTQVQQAFGTGAPGALQIVAPRSDGSSRSRGRTPRPRHRPGLASRSPAANGLALVQAIPTTDPSSRSVGHTIDRLRAALPAGALVGGAAAENHDLERALAAKTPLVIGVVLALGFLLLLIALQAPLIAALGVVTNLLAVGAAFGVGRLIFQNGHGAGLLGFEPQGFLDAWAPVFFFAMIFAISMDYTVFLLSSAKEHWDQLTRPEGRGDRRPRPLRPRHLRRGRRDGRRLLHLRALRPAAAEGDGRHPRCRCPARRDARPTHPDPDAAARLRPLTPGRSHAGCGGFLPDVRFGHA